MRRKRERYGYLLIAVDLDDAPDDADMDRLVSATIDAAVSARGTYVWAKGTNSLRGMLHHVRRQVRHHRRNRR